MKTNINKKEVFKMELNSHYLAQQIKLLALYLDRNVLYPTCCNKKERLELAMASYNKNRANLVRVTKLAPSTIDRLVHACLMAGMVWSSNTEDTGSMWREHDEVLPLVQNTSLTELVQLIWRDLLPYWKVYLEPSTKGIMNIIEGGSYHHLSTYCCR